LAAGFTEETIGALKAAYRSFSVPNAPPAAIRKVEEEVEDCLRFDSSRFHPKSERGSAG
jgi:hypothetical protein